MQNGAERTTSKSLPFTLFQRETVRAGEEQSRGALALTLKQRPANLEPTQRERGKRREVLRTGLKSQQPICTLLQRARMGEEQRRGEES